MLTLSLAASTVRFAVRWLLPIVLAAAWALPAAARAPDTSLAIDAGPEGNGPASLGQIEDCLEVGSGEQFQIDLVISDVEELLAWEIYIGYDPKVLEVTELDVDMFLAGNAGSSVFDVSDPLPDDDGRVRVAAADISDPATPDSGSGTLARITMRALNDGESQIGILREDITDDGRLDFGPFLREVSGEVIGDTNGDTFFDGPVQGATVAVGTSCPPGSLVAVSASNPAGDGGGSNDSWIFVAAGVTAAVLGVIAVGLFFFFRRTGASPMSRIPPEQ